MTRNETRDAADRVRSAHGPLALEELLRADVLADRERVRKDPGLLARPLWIVVPSRSLRVHVARRLTESGTTLAGVEVLTVTGAAHRVLAAAGVVPRRGERLYSMRVEEVLRSEARLEAELCGFKHGAHAAGATVRDLLDAGFSPELLDPALSALHAAQPVAAVERERAAALVRVASAVFEACRRDGTALPSEVARAAVAVLRERPDVVRLRGALVHGFADATAVVLDFLELLLRVAGSRCYVDALATGAFGASLRARLSIAFAAGDPPATPAALALLRAPDVDAEARAVADSVRAELDRGVVAEHIGVVARDLAPYRSGLRRHFARLAIPCSSIGFTGADGPGERRARALAELLQQRAECRVEQWIGARDLESGMPAVERVHFTAGVLALGATNVGALAETDLARRLGVARELRLPVRAVKAGVREDAESRDDDEPEPADEEESPSDARPQPAGLEFERRVVARTALEREVQRATAMLDALSADARGPARDHATRLLGLVESQLGWSATTPGRELLLEALETVVVDVPAGFQLGSQVFASIVADALVEHAGRPFSGAGGGVAILEVVEARGRTFESLHVLGLARGRFPRVVREDPLLGDALRASLGAVLPDLAQKSAGRDEERVLFDSLVRSAPAVHLYWPACDDKEKALLPSALLERVAHVDAIDAALQPSDPTRVDHAGLRTPFEHAISASLHGHRAGFRALAEFALQETRLAWDQPALAGLGASRAAVLDEYEPEFAMRARLGPYFGFVGRTAARGDLRPTDPWVTQLETTARCGWQAFLRFVLGLEPPLDPAAELPDLDARLVGDVVHGVLQQVAREGAAPTWPDERRVADLAIAAAREALAERGIMIENFDALVATRALPLLAIARRLDAANASARVVGTEREGSLPLPEGLHGARRLRFRADRIEQIGSGARWTDFKTGAPINSGKPATMRKHHLAGIAAGTRLQAVAYALAAQSGGAGRYLFLKERADENARVFEIENGDAEAHESFDAAVETLLASWDLGAFAPRLLDASRVKDNAECKRCEVALACVRGDSTAHRRLAAFLDSAGDADDESTRAARTILDLQRPAPKPAKPGEEEAS